MRGSSHRSGKLKLAFKREATKATPTWNALLFASLFRGGHIGSSGGRVRWTQGHGQPIVLGVRLASLVMLLTFLNCSAMSSYSDSFSTQAAKSDLIGVFQGTRLAAAGQSTETSLVRVCANSRFLRFLLDRSCDVRERRVGVRADKPKGCHNRGVLRDVLRVVFWASVAPKRNHASTSRGRNIKHFPTLTLLYMKAMART